MQLTRRLRLEIRQDRRPVANIVVVVVPRTAPLGGDARDEALEVPGWVDDTFASERKHNVNEMADDVGTTAPAATALA